MNLENLVIENISTCRNVSEIIKKIEIDDNGNNYKKIKLIIEENDLNTSHFIKSTRVYISKYNKIERECPKCHINYVTMDGGKKHKKFCSYKCANSKEWTELDKIKKSEIAKNSDRVKEANKINGIKKRNIKIKDCSKSCQNCDIKYCNIKGNSKFCSNNCKSDWWSKHHKKMYADGINYIAGGTTKWLSYKNIKVQGTYELRTCYVLDKMLEYGDIKSWTYTNDRIPYVGVDGNTHTYLLDFKVDSDNGFYYIETKGWKKDNDEFKWDAVKKHGYELKIWYLNDIKKMEIKYKILK